MNPAQTATAERDDVDDTEDQRTAAATAEAQPRKETSLTKFDPQTLKAMTTSPVLGSGMVAFLPASMAEAMEFAKLMASSSFVPPHLRGKPGDCLAIVLQSVRQELFRERPDGLRGAARRCRHQFKQHPRRSIAGHVAGIGRQTRISMHGPRPDQG